MLRNITNISALTFIALALAPTSSSALASSTPDLTDFTDSLCYQVAHNGDEIGTDATDSYRTLCDNFIARQHLTSAHAIVHTICPDVASYSADLNDTGEEIKTEAALKALEHRLIRACFKDARWIAAQHGLKG